MSFTHNNRAQQPPQEMPDIQQEGSDWRDFYGLPSTVPHMADIHTYEEQVDQTAQSGQQIELPGDSWLLTSDGPRQVRDLVGSPCQLFIDGVLHDATVTVASTVEWLILTTDRGNSFRLPKNLEVLISPKVTQKKRYEDWKLVKDLTPSEMLILRDHRATIWGSTGTFDEGYLLGHLVGDGTFGTHPNGSDTAILNLWPEKDAGWKGPKRQILRIARGLPHRSDFKGWRGPWGNGWLRLVLASITRLAKSYGISKGSKTATREVEYASSVFARGFIRGLFDTDGSPQGTQNKGVSIRLYSIDRPLLEAVQRMALRMGINSTIYKRKPPGVQQMPNGKGGNSPYVTKQGYELVIARENFREFANKVSVWDHMKLSRVMRQLRSYKRAMNRERFVTKIVSIQEDVQSFVVSCPTAPELDVDGLHVRNPPKEACL